MPVNVALDVYPAFVKCPDGSTVSKSRAIVADGKLLVFVLSGGKPFLHLEREVQSTDNAPVLKGREVTTADGDFTVKKMAGCGCGNRLKTFNPFPGQTRVRVAS